MQPLSYSFMLFKVCGFWRPKNWSQGWKMMLYNCYTVMTISFVYIFTILQFVNLMECFDDIEQFTNGTFVTLSLIIVCGKIANLMNNREVITELTNVLQNDICKPRNSAEIQIQDECDRSARFTTLWYGALTCTTILSRTVRSFIVDIPHRDLPFKAWLPYKRETNLIGFWIAYVHQTFSHFVSGALNVGYDTLIPGLLMQTCGQIKILKHRLDAVPKTLDAKRVTSWNSNDRAYQKESQLLENKLMTECVRHHHEIFQFAETSNDIFGLVVFFQYFASSVVICFSIFELSKIRVFNSEFAANILYLACMLAEIFNFCFYGNEMTLQSQEICDAVYGMEWFTFGIRTKKCLLTIMLRSLRPITFTCGNIITLSLDSFSSLIKLSYSTYNVLQQSR